MLELEHETVVVDTELSGWLVPVMAAATSILNLQDILRKFSSDNICKIAFCYNPAYLLPSFPQGEFADAFEEAVLISSDRLNAILPIIWKLKRLLGVGSETPLKVAVSRVGVFARGYNPGKEATHHGAVVNQRG